MRIRHIAIFSAAVLAGALAGSLVGPRPAGAVARELIELQRDVTSLLQGQKDLSTQVTQDNTVIKTLVGQSSDNVNKLASTMGSLQKSVQDVQANSGARLDTMSTQVQGLSDNLEEIKSRLGKLNPQLVYLKYYGDTDLASNAQFYLGEIAYSQKQFGQAVAEYEKVLNNYPKSFKLAPARLKKGMALIELGQKNSAVRELREVVKRYPGTEEDRRARAKLKELGVAITATR